MKKETVSGVMLTVLLIGMLTLAFDVRLYAQTETGLVGWWKFDEGSGATAFDSSEYNNDGTIYGATWTTGKFGSALSFDGVDDYVKIPDSDSLDVTGDLTIAAWVRTSQTGFSIIFNNVRQVSPHDGYALEMSAGNLRFYSQESMLYSIGKVNTGSWRHVAVVLSGTTATIYIDGALDNSGAVNVPSANDLNQTIGASYTPYYFFQGIIDEVRVYNRALSPREIGVLSGQVQLGPRIDTLRFKVNWAPVAQYIEMTVGPPTGSDVWTSSIRAPWTNTKMVQALENGGMTPGADIAMSGQGKTLSSTPAYHIATFGFNYRKPPLDDVNFRHALAHLVPKDFLIGSLLSFTAIRINTPVPPARGVWYNPNVDPHPYSRTEAEAILASAGYQRVGGVWRMPDGNPIQRLRVYMPTEITAPTSYTIGRIFCDECAAIGLTSVQPEPMDFATYTFKTFNEWDFEIFWVCWDLGRDPTHLWDFFYSENSFKGSYNPYGMNYPELDAQIDIFYQSFQFEPIAVQAAQELIMGGTIEDPLAIPAQPERSQAIPVVPVYSRVAYDAQNPGLRGAVNMEGYGINNMWTWMNIHWDSNDDGVADPRPGTTDNMVVPILDEFPERLNPTSARTVYAWTFMDPVYDPLIAVNPYTLRDMPWLATEWRYAAAPGGIDVSFNLRTLDPGGYLIRWQDGASIQPSDVAFAWEFLRDKAIPKYYGSMQFLSTVNVLGNWITASMNTTSPWLLYDLAGTALMFPPQVWEPWLDDPTAAILAWDPSATPGPGGLPTSIYGTGPFILQHSTTYITTYGYGDLNANRNLYWLTTTEIQTTLSELFWRAGDVDRDGAVTISGDISKIGYAWDTRLGDPRWIPEADITNPYGGPPDNWIYAADLTAAGINYGLTKNVPP